MQTSEIHASGRRGSIAVAAIVFMPVLLGMLGVLAVSSTAPAAVRIDPIGPRLGIVPSHELGRGERGAARTGGVRVSETPACLLYTSDAADE